MVVVFAAAMAWVEAAVVFYLRSMMHRIEPYQPDPLPVMGGFAPVELPRELATLVMLFAVGWLAGRTWRARLGYFAIAFGMWDIFYYALPENHLRLAAFTAGLGHFVFAADAVVGAGARAGLDFAAADLVGHARLPIPRNLAGHGVQPAGLGFEFPGRCAGALCLHGERPRRRAQRAGGDSHRPAGTIPLAVIWRGAGIDGRAFD